MIRNNSRHGSRFVIVIKNFLSNLMTESSDNLVTEAGGLILTE